MRLSRRLRLGVSRARRPTAHCLARRIPLRPVASRLDSISTKRLRLQLCLRKSLEVRNPLSHSSIGLGTRGNCVSVRFGPNQESRLAGRTCITTKQWSITRVVLRRAQTPLHRVCLHSLVGQSSIASSVIGEPVDIGRRRTARLACAVHNANSTGRYYTRYTGYGGHLK